MENNDRLSNMGCRELLKIKKNMMDAINSIQRLLIDAEILCDFDMVAQLNSTAKCCFNVLGSIKNQEELELLNSYKAAPIDVKTYLADFVSACNLRLRTTAFTVCLECDDDIYISVDADRLAACLTNLVVNAVQYNSVAEENIEIWVRVRKFSDCVSIAVCDEGYGMNSEELHQILESDSTTGGFAVLKKFCKMANAQIISDTRVDGGFMLSFRLPMANVNAVKPSQAENDGGSVQEANRPQTYPVSYGDFSAVNVLMTKIKDANIIY